MSLCVGSIGLAPISKLSDLAWLDEWQVGLCSLSSALKAAAEEIEAELKPVERPV